MKIERYQRTPIAEKYFHKRQLILAPSWAAGDRLVLCCSSQVDISKTSEEDIRLDAENFPMIAVLKRNGVLQVSGYQCFRKGLYTESASILDDLTQLLAANKISAKIEFI